MAIMNVAVIIAAGVGNRMHQDTPKQFIEVYDKPIIIYTLEGFEHHEMVDAIEVVCLEGYEDYLWDQARKYGITKLKWVTNGGASGQESIFNGLKNLEGKISPNDLVIIHDGVRPMVDPSVLTDVIEVASRKGNAVTSLPYNEQIFILKDEESTNRYIPREQLRRVSTPQAYGYGLLLRKYEEAFEKKIGIYGSSYANTMMVELGETLYFAKGSDKNIKLTTPDDLEIFKAYLKVVEEEK